ncbi:uncharacterized protein LOC127836305 isoform X2 [Dreissena polymorpha]|uniref:Asl1-like glycosyl hydrolase catalytic domain-containing protein n=1 Tax=Dreissena polymorpha TaxID=45954 RepID=A0A9D4JAH5_DREPO|nr:uncharacterized protein LOC127836305 isoform X2 [Dreissena polymorpha]KAH3804620.1 hypothetical protein DPMN_132909 [Dreissena polymorpha]
MLKSRGSILLLVCLGLLALRSRAASQKKGLSAYAPFFLCDDFRVLNNMSWWYGWEDAMNLYNQYVTNKCPSPQAHMPEFVPMVWSMHSNNVSRWIHIPSNSKYVLGFNEPDHRDQANMTPQEAADYWPLIEQAAVGIPLVAPAPGAQNFHWLDTFLYLCHNCRIDYFAAHLYSCNADETMAYLQKLYTRYHKPIWLTEFGCAYMADEESQLRLMQALLPKLEAADYVFRYSWFTARIKKDTGGGFVRTSMSLLAPNSATLTRLGHFYNDFQSGHGTGSVPVG